MDCEDSAASDMGPHSLYRTMRHLWPFEVPSSNFLHWGFPNCKLSCNVLDMAETTTKTPTTPMSEEHKAALAQGRLESRVVREYLEALRTSKPKRGRKRSMETIEKRLAAIEEELATADTLSELLLLQERNDLQVELAGVLGGQGDLSSIEAEFVSVARSYSDRRQISYATWREIGVDAAVLKRAGVTRSM